MKYINVSLLKSLILVLVSVCLSACGGNSTQAYLGYSYQSNFLSLSDGKTMHHLDEGDLDAKPVLLLHGVPTSAYLWRDVIPGLKENSRVIVPDLIGFGKSSKTDNYDFTAQVEYLGELIDFLALDDVRLVVHDWGGPIGLLYAARNSENIAGIVIMETSIAPFPSESILPDEVKLFRDPLIGRQLIVNENRIIEGNIGNNQFNGEPSVPVEQRMLLRDLDELEFFEYSQPFINEEDREIIYQYPLQLGFLDQPGPLLDVWMEFSAYIASAPIPKQFIFGNPGFGMIPDRVFPDALGDPMVDSTTGEFVTLRNVVEGRLSAPFGGWSYPGTTVSLLTPSTHFIQEDAHEELTKTLNDWLFAEF